MRYLILVKGDGRGHLTQALSLTQLLLNAGHTVGAIVIGAPADALMPEFIMKKSPVPVIRLDSPNLKLNAAANHIDWVKTIWTGLVDTPKTLASLRALRALIAEHRPDAILNLFEPLVALNALTHRMPPVVNVGHQYIMLHADFRFPAGRWLERCMISGYTAMLRPRGSKSLALSFYDMPEDRRRGIYAVPPLLRSEVFERRATAGDHLLVYMVYHGISEQIKAFNQQHPQVRIHAFWSKKDVPAELHVSNTLTFHQINDVLFLDKLASARGVATTAGFETVAEAFYYRKPAILLPMPGQYEQYVNAADAEHVGAGRRVDALDPAALEAFVPEYQPQHEAYLTWIEQGRARLLWHLEHPADFPGREVVPTGPDALPPPIPASA